MFLDFLVKNKFIFIVPIDKTYFHCVDFTSDKKLSYDSIVFNYQRLSPFLESDISYIQTNDKILLWFYEKKYDELCIVPEGYLQYQFFLKNNDNTLINIENTNITIIQNGILCYQSIFENFSSQEIQLLQKEYHIQRVVEKSESWYKKNRKRIINQPILPILKYFMNREKVLQLLKEKISSLIIPSLIFLLSITAIQFGINQYLEKELTTYKSQKHNTKKKAKYLFDAISKNNQNILFIKKYLSQHNQDILNILNQLGEICYEEKVKLYFIEFNRHSITLNFIADSVENLLEKLSSIDKIQSFKLSRQIKTKDGKLEVSVELKLKKEESK